MRIKRLNKKRMRELLSPEVKILGKRNLFSTDYEEWKNLRNSFIGGSEAGAIIGVNPYSSPADVYCDKIYGSDFDGNEATFQGQRLEEWIATEFASRNPDYEVLSFGYTLKKGNCGANVDFILRDKISGDWGILEIKSGGERSLKKWEISHTEENYTNIAVDVPPYYYAQVQHYLGVSGFKFGFIGAFVGNKYIQTPKFDANPEEIKYILGECEKIWVEHIVPKRPPLTPDGSKGMDRVLNNEFEPSENGEAQLDEKIDLVEEYRSLTAQAKEIDARLKEIKQQLIINMENNKKGRAGTYKITRGSQTRSKLNKDKLYKELGQEKADEFYSSYIVNTFSIKEVKE